MAISVVQRSRTDSWSRYRNFKVRDSYALAPVIGADGVRRVRLAVLREQKGQYLAYPFYVEDVYYLDGLHESTQLSKDKINTDRTIMEPAAVPMRTKDVMDFGRLQTAVQTLVGQMQRYNPEKDPDGEQMQSFIRSYQTILEWQRRAKEQFTMAEGQIDVAATVLRGVMGV